MKRIITTTLLIVVSTVAGFSVASFRDHIQTMNDNLANGGACNNFHYAEGTLTITASGPNDTLPVLYTFTVQNVDEEDMDVFQSP